MNHLLFTCIYICCLSKELIYKAILMQESEGMIKLLLEHSFLELSSELCRHNCIDLQCF